MDEKIDIVLPWVDGNDSTWRAEKEKYHPKNSELNSEDRYRDWDNLYFIFRGIEEFLPWVNKIYFITHGHLPKWLNKNHPKLKIVKHEEYIPSKWLPIFNSHPIELNLHRLKDLSERFIYFNDDFFVLKPMKKEEFFKNFLPVDMAIMDMAHDGTIRHIDSNNIDIISKHHNRHVDPNLVKQKIVLRNFSKWFNLGYGKYNLQNLLLLYFKFFTGFKFNHFPQPYLKSTLKEVWEVEKEFLEQVSKNKFRTNEDVNQYLFRYWQLLGGKFTPANKKDFIDSRAFKIIRTLDSVKQIVKDIESGSYKLFCINDGTVKGRFTKEDMSQNDFELSKTLINQSLEKVLPKKSSYEK